MLWRALLFHQDRVLLAVVFLSTALAALEALGLLAEKMSPRRWGPRRRGPAANADLKRYWPEALGGLVGFAAMSAYPLWAALAALGGVALARLGKAALRRLAGRVAEERRAGEALLLYEVVSVYSSAGYSLYEALSAGLYLVNLAEGPLRRCLKTWGQGPQRALERLGEELAVPEGRALGRILRRAAVVGPGRLAEFLDRESAAMESIRQYRVERGLGARPLVQTLYLALPGLALLGVTLFPIGYHIARMITSVRLS
ncbi:hypothetical protein H5T53_00540 [Candidatus Bipolaricaulota bacterium]|nr:hypothetical protein [Candidatus Bipolaricaulota bacterium]